MPSRFLLLALLLPPMTLEATVITTAWAGSPSCSQTRTTQGELTASAYASCGGASSGASVEITQDPFNFVHPLIVDLHSGSSSNGGFSAASATASFDIDVRVVGTDQPGFVALHILLDYPPNHITLGEVHSTFVKIQGDWLPLYGSLYGYHGVDRYIPYSPGSTIRLFGEMGTAAGALDIAAGGSAGADWRMYVRFTTEATFPDPLVPGTRVTIIPEPSIGALVFTTLAALTYLFRRHRLH